MRVGRLLFWGACFGWVASGCESDLKLSLDDLQCNDKDRCSTGYACDKITNRCVRNDLGLEAGSAAGAAGNPAGGAGSGQGGSSGSAGTDGVGGASSIGGQGGSVDGTAGSDDVLDAGPPELVDGGPDGCVPTTLFRDRDRDTYGDVADRGQGCPQRGWATRAGDCRDDIGDVHPGQLEFFGGGFVDQTKPGNISFDYDCTGVEEPSPNNNTNAPAPNCEGLSLTCTGSGFLPANDPPRTGSGADARCGSILRRVCQTAGLGCASDDTEVAERFRFLCH